REREENCCRENANFGGVFVFHIGQLGALFRSKIQRGHFTALVSTYRCRHYTTYSRECHRKNLTNSNPVSDCSVATDSAARPFIEKTLHYARVVEHGLQTTPTLCPAASFCTFNF